MPTNNNVSLFGNSSIKTKVMKSRSNIIQKAILDFKKTKKINVDLFKQSPSEYIVFLALTECFGINNVLYQYGLHPYDRRYPYVCDFYIKSKDLFIELNGHYSHGNHWFDSNNHDDVLRKKHLILSAESKNLHSVDVWTNIDLIKKDKACSENLNYLVFWDGSVEHKNKKIIPNLKDFYLWLYDYKGDYDKFIHDYPQNTY